MRRKYQTFPAKAENPYRKSKNGISSWQRISELTFALGKDKSDMRQLITESMKN